MVFKFFWNGIKGSDKVLQKASYSEGGYTNYPEGTITIYAKSYRRFSAEVAEMFAIHNDSDGQTDYFETDMIRVVPFHPLYAAVKAACDAQVARWEKRRA
jgi:hypothetical protein